MIPKNIQVNDFKYEPPTVAEYNEFAAHFEKWLSAFSEIEGIVKDSIIVNERMVIQTLIRIDQRRDYFRYYHSDETAMIMSQEKLIALLAYWIIKYKPLTQDKKAMENYFDKNRYTINESFALFLIKNLMYVIRKGNKGTVTDLFNEKKSKITKYYFAQRDMSKEAFILYVSSLIGSLEM